MSFYGSLRIRRDRLVFPQIDLDEPIEQFVHVIPAVDVKILPDGHSDHPEDDRKTLLARLSPWRQYSNQSALVLPLHIRQTLSAMSRAARSDTLVNGDLTSGPEDSDAPPPDVPSEADFVSGRESRATEQDTLLLRTVADREVTVWMVDRHLDLALMGILVGLVVVLPIIKFFSLEFGERLAERPMLSFILIGAVWWFCLQASVIGFVVLVLASLGWAGLSLMRHFRRRPQRGLTVS